MDVGKGIGPDLLRMMARYNAWQNRSLLDAADGLDDAARCLDRGAFFGSISRTLSHLLWGDLIWMSRFDGGAAPGVGIPDSPDLFSDWVQYKAARREMDRRILDWAEAARASDCAGDLTWWSGAMGAEVTRPCALVFTHFFNHQTHHRGQVHAMLTAAGAKPGDTDLFIMPEGNKDDFL